MFCIFVFFLIISGFTLFSPWFSSLFGLFPRLPGLAFEYLFRYSWQVPSAPNGPGSTGPVAVAPSARGRWRRRAWCRTSPWRRCPRTTGRSIRCGHFFRKRPIVFKSTANKLKNGEREVERWWNRKTFFLYLIMLMLLMFPNVQTSQEPLGLVYATWSFQRSQSSSLLPCWGGEIPEQQLNGNAEDLDGFFLYVDIFSSKTGKAGREALDKQGTHLWIMMNYNVNCRALKIVQEAIGTKEQNLSSATFRGQLKPPLLAVSEVPAIVGEDPFCWIEASNLTFWKDRFCQERGREKGSQS